MSLTSRQKRLLIRIVLATVALLVCFSAIKSCCTGVNIKGYSGDGVISTIDEKINPGFYIDFEDINLSKPFHSEYRIENYPKINDEYMFGISVSVPEPATYDLLKSARGSLQMTLFTKDRKIVFQAKDDISKWWLSWGGNEGFFYYMPNNCDELQSNDCVSGFYPGHVKKKLRDPLFLGVIYAPAGTLVDFQGKLRMEAGGYL